MIARKGLISCCADCPFFCQTIQTNAKKVSLYGQWLPSLRNFSLSLPSIVQLPLLGQVLLISEASCSHSDTSQLVGFLWTSDQPVSDTSTWQQVTLTKDRHPCIRRIRTRNPNNREAADPCLGPALRSLIPTIRDLSYSTLHKLQSWKRAINPLNPELNHICYLLAVLGAHHFLHVSRVWVKLLTLRRLMSYIYGAPILDVSRSHTTTQHSR